MKLSSIFIDDSSRVRSGWRVAVFLVSCFFATLAALVAGSPLFALLEIRMTQSSTSVLVIQFLISATAALFFGWLWGRLLEDLPFRALGAWFTGGWFRDLIWGLVIGAASIGLAAGIVAAFGGLSIGLNRESAGQAVTQTLLNTLIVFIFGALFEEAFFRGYALQTLFRARYAAFGIVLTSLFFATTHNANPGANPLSWFNTFLAGIWLAVAYAKTRNLWFPFGIHLAWNWVQGSVLGITVSGLETLAPDPLMRATVYGPEWLSGGNYGVEGGVACSVALLVSTAVIAFAPFLKPTREMLEFTTPAAD
ncbi:MAG: CPBP family intramembrane metalloprotease [Acidobacteria bacterium]|nr:CPBP family intramembrane metalloprotease [Acidobacteriota bacterium]MBK8147891.1 CPBP family intramembrane metalloprotease [Acidobacteriota bacterium]